MAYSALQTATLTRAPGYPIPYDARKSQRLSVTLLKHYIFSVVIQGNFLDLQYTFEPLFASFRSPCGDGHWFDADEGSNPLAQRYKNKVSRTHHCSLCATRVAMTRT